MTRWFEDIYAKTIRPIGGSVVNLLGSLNVQSIISNNVNINDSLRETKQSFRAIGRTYTNADCCSANTTTIHLGNSLTFVPLVISKDCILDRIGVQITSAGDVGSLGRLGLYNSSNCSPTTLIADYGTFATSSNAVISLVINQTLERGLYFVAFIHNSTLSVTLRAIALACVMPILGISSTIGTSYYTYISANFTFASLPSDTTSLTLTNQAGVPLLISFRLSG